MAKDQELSRVLGWIDTLNTSLDAARRDQTAMSNLLTSAEYELQQVRRQLSGAVAPDQVPDARVPLGSVRPNKPESGTQFAQKLRHPEGLRNGWWTVLAEKR